MSKKITIEIDVPEFEGYEFVRYGMPVEGEFYLSITGRALDKASGLFDGKIEGYSRPVYRKAPKWRPATLADVQRALDNVPVVARFSDGPGKDWTCALRHLVGVDITTSGVRGWYSSPSCSWVCCEVRVDE